MSNHGHPAHPKHSVPGLHARSDRENLNPSWQSGGQECCDQVACSMLLQSPHPRVLLLEMEVNIDHNGFNQTALTCVTTTVPGSWSRGNWSRELLILGPSVRVCNTRACVLSRREVSARQDAMTYLVRVRGLLSGW